MEEKRLMEEKQKKVDQIYSQVQHHNAQWVSLQRSRVKRNRSIILLNFCWSCNFSFECPSLIFWCRDSGEEFLPFLLVAKGKRLIGRLLPFLKRDAAFNVLRVMTLNLPLLMSRDSEEVKFCEIGCCPAHEDDGPFTLWVVTLLRPFHCSTLLSAMSSGACPSVSWSASLKICLWHLTSLWRWHVRTRSALRYWCTLTSVGNMSDSSSCDLPVWTVLTVCSPVTRREAPVLWCSPGAQHRGLWDLVRSFF